MSFWRNYSSVSQEKWALLLLLRREQIQKFGSLLEIETLLGVSLEVLVVRSDRRGDESASENSSVDYSLGSVQKEEHHQKKLALQLMR